MRNPGDAVLSEKRHDNIIVNFCVVHVHFRRRFFRTSRFLAPISGACVISLRNNAANALCSYVVSNRWVFSLFLKTVNEIPGARSSAGRLLHTRGPWTAKLRSVAMFRPCSGNDQQPALLSLRAFMAACLFCFTQANKDVMLCFRLCRTH